MTILQRAAHRRPRAFACIVTALLWLTLWLGYELAHRLVPDSDYAYVVYKLPPLVVTLGLLFAGGWWRDASFWAGPSLRGVTIAWPVLLHVVFAAGLVAWRGPWAWGGEIARAGVTALWEEMAFRGIVVAVLLRCGKAWAVCGSAVLFAAVHFMNARREESILAAGWEIAWPLGVGLLYAGILLRSGTIWIGVVAHGLMNLLRATSVKPLTWTGWTVHGEPVDWGVLLALYVVCAVALSWPGRWIHRVALGTGALFVGMLVVGLARGGPRPGWNGPVWNATLTMLYGEPGQDGWREYRYRLDYPPSDATVVRVTVHVAHGDGEVRDVTARAGAVRWAGASREARLTWEGGTAPRTDYTFFSTLSPPRKTRFRVDYVDRFGWPRAWEGALELPE